MKLKRAPNLSAEYVQEIVSILDGWSGPLSWNLLIDAVYSRLHSKYTRQALHKHQRIKIAFEIRKRNLTAEDKHFRGSLQIQKALERISRLEAENQRLQGENDRLLEQFARWAFNAYVRGIPENELNRPLPEIDRRPTPMLVHSSSKRS
jgi:hypothetical protein